MAVSPDVAQSARLSDLLVLNQSRVPAATDDLTLGFVRGVVWEYTPPAGSSDFYLCRDASEGAAVWEAITGAGSVATHAASHEAGGSDPIDVLALGAIPLSQRAVASGVATLDVTGKLTAAQLPSGLAVRQIFTVANQVAMLALAAAQGDVAVRTDLVASFQLGALPASSLGNWIQIANSSGTGTVTSVGLTLPAMFSVTGSPVTTSGSLAATLATQTANTFLCGPTTGAAAAPTFRTLDARDLGTAATNQFLQASSTSAMAWVTMSGDATLTAGALTLANVISAGGPVGTASAVPVITYDAKGRLTAVTTTTITPAAIGAPPNARAVATQHSLTGGGDLSADRTLSLVNDTASPGNSKFYGTDGSGVRGWFTIATGSITLSTAVVSATGSQNVDFSLAQQQVKSLAVTNSGITLTITASNYAQNTHAQIRILNTSGGSITLAWPGTWRIMSAALPTTLAAGKSLICAISVDGATAGTACAQATTEI